MQRIALVIGGASGIGAASAIALAQVDMCVAIADIDSSAAATTVERMPGAGHQAMSVDASDETQMVSLFSQVEAEMGQPSVLIFAAGTAGYVNGIRPNLRTTSVNNWDSVLALNLRGAFLAVREMLRRIAARPIEHGRIVLIGSMAAQMLARNSPPAYIASKGGLMAMARVAASEAAALGATVNLVSPGAIDTPMLRAVMQKEQDADYFDGTIAGRAGSPDEVAAAIAFLASIPASYINGACIDVNGGMLMR
ncbi:SDR family NAD(P)-dependent oxidoreductase [Sphingosinicella rhizophila]|uniref:SDR family oxidoreductase n=1 Tax=Sphingosinicella rhizophila TaxID=3050082 RepID=A0ABU3QAU3_9SPHN|nr:SDR family oxidoreductase [Sphingosinicella sp. GR2756]MDT9600531.1 SDR family oxidoreductase [Sphingosinicella sp. GR2756]